MIAALVLHLLVVGGLASAAGVLGERALRRLGLPQRTAWGVALALTVALPLAAWRGAATAPPPIALAATAPAAAPVTDAPPPAALSDRLAALVPAALPVPRVLVKHDRLVAAGWALVALVALVRLGAAAARLRRWRRTLPAVRLHDLTVRVAPDAGPAVAGLGADAIVLPRWAVVAPDETVRLMLAHEREHVRARDPWLLLAADLLVALLPWHPALRWQRARLRLAVEVDCDARVLRRHPARRAYAELLLAVARRPARPLLAPAAALAARPSTLSRRIDRMTAPTPRRRLVPAALLAAGAGALTLAACEAPRPTAPSPAPEMPLAEVAREAPEASEATATMRAPDPALRVLIEDAVARGTVAPGEQILVLRASEGAVTRVSGLAALGDAGVRPERIASIEVLKGATAERLAGPAAAGGLVTVRLKGAEATSPTGAGTAASASASASAPSAPSAPSAASIPAGARIRIRGTGAVTVVPATPSAPIAPTAPMAEPAPSASVMPAPSPVAAPAPAPAPVVAPSPAAAPTTIRIRPSHAAPPAALTGSPLVVIDGAVQADGERALQRLAPSAIERMEILKGDAARKAYGERGADGVIRVTTKPHR